jgi:thiol-disulfide isomerase/thioredoxin
VARPGNCQHALTETQAPGFKLPVIGDARGSLDGLLAAGQPVLLIFADADCGPCKELLPEVKGWQERFGNRLTIAVVGSGWRKKHARPAAGLANLFVQEKREVAERYGVPGTPAGVLIRPDGMLVSRVVTGADGVRQLLQAALSPTPRLQATGAGGNGRAGAPQPPKAEVTIGQLVPPVTLRDLDGAEVDLANWLGQETILLFWSPSCGFCQRVLPELRGWERQRPAGVPRLLLISTGAAEANRAMELASPVLLDDAFHTGRLFGAAGTPSAVLIDREGKVASGVAVGGPAVLALAGIKEARNEPTV